MKLFYMILLTLIAYLRNLQMNTYICDCSRLNEFKSKQILYIYKGKRIYINLTSKEKKKTVYKIFFKFKLQARL
jgi:hypothetical protein